MRTRHALVAAAALGLLLRPAGAAAQGGLDLGGPRASPERPAPGPAPGLAVAPLDLGRTVDVGPRLAAAAKLARDGHLEEAALADDAILREPGLAGGHDDARIALAQALLGMGLDASALTVVDQILELGPARSRHVEEAMGLLFRIGERLGNEQVLLSRVARLARYPVPAADRGRFDVLLATYQFERGRALEEAGRAEEARASWLDARRLAALVSPPAGETPRPGVQGRAAPEADAVPRALFIDGLALYALRDEAGADERFKEVVRLTAPGRGGVADPVLREQAFLQLARIHYENRQNRFAIFYYSKMPWGGRSWLEGLWESSWAHYRLGEHEKALGNLLTIQSAYFRDEYFPESWVLKAIIYYENCRYPEARLVLQDFDAAYEPLYQQLVAISARPPGPVDVLALGATPRLQRLAATDPSVRRLLESAAQVEAEATTGLGRRGRAFRASALAASLRASLARLRAQALAEAGLRARGKLENERDQLRAILAQALRIRIEVSRQEREALEGSLAAGMQVEVVRNLHWTHAVSDEQLYWPYEGEFWRDELGTYSYTLTRGCKGRPPRSSGR